MDFFLITALVLFYFLLNSKLEKQHLSLLKRLDALQLELAGWRKPGPVPEPAEMTATVATPVAAAMPPPVVPISEPVHAPEAETQPEEEQAFSLPEPVPVAPEETPEPIKAPAPPRPPRDWEKFIGENLANKVGIGVLVIGIGFFIRYAIDQNWIGEVGRLLIGFAIGLLLMGIAFRLRKQMQAFSSVLIGGGVVVHYLTIVFAFHEYALIGETTAFVAMVAVTLLAVAQSVSYNRVELAVVSLVGGFLTPFMVSSGSGSYVNLFSYLLILNTGMLLLAYFKQWKAVHVVAYAGTVLLFGGWLLFAPTVDRTAGETGLATFALLFYTVFFAMNLVAGIRGQRQMLGYERTILLSASVLAWAAAMYVLQGDDFRLARVLVTSYLMLANMAVSTWLYFRQSEWMQHALWLTTGLAFLFLSLMPMVYWQEGSVTICWAIEMVVLYVFYQKTGLATARNASLLLLLATSMRVWSDWSRIYLVNTEPLPVVLNQGMLVSVVFLLALFAKIWLSRNEQQPYTLLKEQMEMSVIRKIFYGIFLVMAYSAGLLEVVYQANDRLDDFFQGRVLVGVYQVGFPAICFGAFALWGNPRGWLVGLAIGALGLLGFVGFYQWQLGPVLQQALVNGTPYQPAFGMHWLGLLFAGVLVVTLFRYVRQATDWPPALQSTVYGYLSVCVVLMASAAMYWLVYFQSVGKALLPDRDAWESFVSLQGQVTKVGLPILWGGLSFILILLGMRWKIRVFRLFALLLFATTLVKLFLFDIRGISEGGKIVAFLLLGVLLLTVSFLYQRIKEVILKE